MGVVTPNGDLHLIQVNMDPVNQMYFTNKADQETFFLGRAVAGVSPADYTFIQKDEMVRVHKNADLLYNANYLMYRNTAHADRWFFAWIKEIKWLSDSSSAILFETDVYQTWRWDVSFRHSLIERETPPSDNLGEHLIEEGLEYGDYIVSGEKTADLGEMKICVATTIKAITKSTIAGAPWSYYREAAEGALINNIYSGVAIIAWPNDSSGIVGVNDFLKLLTEGGASDAVTAVYMAPKKAIENITNFGNKTFELSNLGKYVPTSQDGYVGPVLMGSRPTRIENYTPLNKKLLSYPYCMVYAHNNNGASAVYDIDEFAGSPSFHVVGSVGVMPQFKLVPQLYRGIQGGVTDGGYAWDEALTLQNYPMCNYNIDAYKAWAAQNGVSTTVGVVGQIAAAAGSVGLALAAAPATGGMSLAGVMAIGSVTQATQSLAKAGEKQMAPPQAASAGNTGSVNSSMEVNDFYCYYKTIREEWAKILDQYFTMYGYKVNTVKAPSFGCRERFYYCKMINPNIVGPIPVTDMGELKNLFSNGMTLWNTHSDIGIYPSPGSGIRNNPVTP